ncbi:hypothetical protein Z043_120239 [Scleropages formosus]|uniref:LIM zinc-binding domain-containing protein n=1 Tax=Scleropages formosus TaxID=113540 RepID=A0A0P7U3T1_SCLFO|nr:hypothetical protein Z043_120239 [Scleropages formosus]
MLSDWLSLSLCAAAERVTSLGKDWHRPCLKCEKCNKTLSAGSHAEVGTWDLEHARPTRLPPCRRVDMRPNHNFAYEQTFVAVR